MPLLAPTHRCNVCQQELPRSCFSRSKAYRSGLQNRCKVCMREYRQRHYVDHGPALRAKAMQQRKRNSAAPPTLLAEMLQTSGCCECGTTERPRHFKLREGPRSFNLPQAQQIGVTRARLLEELKKYDIVCELCCPPRMRYTDAYHELRNAQIEQFDGAPPPKRGQVKRLMKALAADTGRGVQQVPDSGEGGSQ